MRTNIALIGMMGTSKSTSGKVLADKLEMLFLDVDGLIEYEDQPITKIFKEYGEEYFRELESKKIARISGYENIVIATGGGVVKREENMMYLRKSSYIVLLTARPEIILERIKTGKKRPLLKKPTLQSVKQILEERNQVYAKYADISVDTSYMTPNQTADAIQDKLCAFIGALKGQQKGKRW